MGRFLKDGVDYFTLECHLEDNVKLVEAEFGIKGFGVIIKLWQKIYSDKGYYTKWSRPVALMFARDSGVGIGVVEEVVKASLREGIFDQKLYDTYGILTSRGIQKRYVEATRKRELVKFEKAYLLIAAPKNVIYSDINEENTAVNEISDGNSNVNVSKYQKENEITTTTTTESACTRVENVPSDDERFHENLSMEMEVKRYFEDNYPQFTKGLLKDTYNALNEAQKFVAYNAKRGWDCLPNWKAAADLWVVRLGEKGGKG